MTAVAVGVDLGGTKIAAGVVDADGNILRRAEMPSDIDDAEGVSEQIRELVKQLGADGITGIGIGAAGIVDNGTGHYYYGPNTGLRDVDLGAMAAEVTGMTVKIDNDANCAAWAEHRFGVGEGCDNFMCVTLGTGIGGGLVLGGQRYRGTHGGAAEIGHMMLDPDGPRCGCGRHGCWEQYASGLALERMGREALGREIRGPEITQAARDGDELARGLVKELAQWIGIGLGSLVNILDPGKIAIAGGIVRDWDLFESRAVFAMRDQIEASDRRPVPEVVAAKLGADAGVVGAALLVLEA